MITDSINKGNVLSPDWPANVDKYETLVGSEHPDIDSSDILVESHLVLDGKVVQAYLTKTNICWHATYASTKTRKHRQSTHVVHIAELFLTRYEQKKEKRKRSNDHIELLPSQYFSIHFAKKGKHHKWKYQTITFHTSDSEECQTWVTSIRNLLEELERPKRLLVFINPVGGKKLAEKIYREKVAPLFDIAQIVQNVVVTERINHSKEYLQSEDLTPYDGVLSVGGDGMFSEVMNGLLRYEHDSHQAPKSRLGKPIIIGIIPAGSTDTVAYCTIGSNCPVTAALHIILGDQMNLDVCSVWHDDTFLKYSVSLMGYGYFGDIAKDSEALRWMGPKRYDYAGVKKFLANRSYEGEVKFIEAPASSDEKDGKVKCTAGCQRCSVYIDDAIDGSDEQWKTESGRFISVIGANISCRCSRSSTGLSPHAHTGDGHIDLILIRKTSRTRYLHHLIKVSERTTEHFNFSFIEVRRVKEFKFRAVVSTPPDDNANTGSSSSQASQRETSVWNVDGEVVEFPDLHIKVHRQLITLFARGLEE